MNKKALMALISMAAAGIASAANVDITSDITTSTTWNSTNIYNLTKQIYVRSGATLTIPAGTLIKSGTAVTNGGSLAVSRGAKIYVNGTKENPVVMTSFNDNGTARVACNEWGNLTLMGKGLISASSDSVRTRVDNTKTPDGDNVVQMEGIIADGTNTVTYGGNDDNDDSGSIHYLSLRYGGKVIGLNNELNGLSLGGIGRETDIDHVEIFNNVDDGIEIWGGAVNLKYISIWNIGDDSLDIDQGWRGKAQFGLIVQGLSAQAKQGSGWGDNCFETDGAEDSDASPATTCKIANFTVIGQPDVSGGGDGATVWRDNARVQYHNCLFMNIGEEIVRLDGNDTDGAQGYNYALNGVAAAGGSAEEMAAFQGLWSAPYTSYYADNFVTNVYATVADMYLAQTSGNQCEIRNSVMFANATDSGDKATAVGVYNVAMNNVVASVPPIVALTRGSLVTYSVEDNGTKTAKLYPVTYIDPRATNDAVNAAAVEQDEFLTSAPFAGGFSANNNWIEGWTAAAQYGLTTSGVSAADPVSTIQMTASTFFQTTAGVVYTVEESSDMKNWTPVATVTGDGSIKSATDLAAFNSAKFYRAIVL
ncbi:MAG: hypothetical protein WC334_00490 [Kiritimatiellales bacterium]|jgi:hypothetical protein